MAIDGGLGGNISVEREVGTDAGNKIDLLVTSDDHAVLIENKIYAGVANPFPDYADCLDRRIVDGRAKHKLLLAVPTTSEGSKWGFTNLTCEEFVERIRSLLGGYISNADNRYLTIFLDFLNTLENLRKGSRMDPRFVELLAERQEDAEAYVYELTRFKAELRKKPQELRNLIDVAEYRNVEQRLERERTSLYDDLVTDIRLSKDLLVSVETSIFPQGWEIWISPRSGNYSELKNLLQRLEIPFEEYEDDGGFTHRDNFAHKYNEDLDDIRTLLQDLIDKLATSRKRKTQF